MHQDRPPAFLAWAFRYGLGLVLLEPPTGGRMELVTEGLVHVAVNGVLAT